jgi:hypothetical protein
VLLTIDPGMNSPGVAVFQEGREALVAAGRVLMSWELAELPAGERWLRVAKEIVAWFVSKVGPAACAGPTIVFECPQWYSRGKSKGDPNQLVGIAGVAANVTGLLQPRAILSPTPAEWIGQLPKTCKTCGANKKKCLVCKGSSWNTPRGQRIRSRLSEAELALVPDQNDAIDACGLGLWSLGRLTPRSVLSNGRDGK